MSNVLMCCLATCMIGYNGIVQCTNTHALLSSYAYIFTGSEHLTARCTLCVLYLELHTGHMQTTCSPKQQKYPLLQSEVK